jgi:hypothetical protein
MRRAAAIAFVIATFAAAPHALADAIDGDWCSAGGKNLRIDGPSIRTPAGVRTTGRYTRHAFAYEPPHGDPDQGQLVVMEQLSEELMHLVRVKEGIASPVEEWRRCNVTS